jgi:hypothetical protein
MKTRLGAYSVLGMAIVVACGGSSGGEGDNGLPGPVPPNGSGDTPPPGFDTPPGQDPPPGGYDDPSGPGTTPGATGSGTCASVCQMVIAEGCTDTDLGADVRSCTTNCDAAITQADCGPELLAFLACLVRSPEFTCDVLTGDVEVQPGQFAECQTQALALEQCNDGGGEGGQGGI